MRVPKLFGLFTLILPCGGVCTVQEVNHRITTARRIIQWMGVPASPLSHVRISSVTSPLVGHWAGSSAGHYLDIFNPSTNTFDEVFTGSNVKVQMVYLNGLVAYNHGRLKRASVFNALRTSGPVELQMSLSYNGTFYGSRLEPGTHMVVGIIVPTCAATMSVWMTTIPHQPQFKAFADKTAEVCAAIQETCSGVNEVFPTAQDCADFWATIPTVAPAQPPSSVAIGNSRTCRLVHLTIAGTSPDLHCMHVAPQSNRCCDDCPYTNQTLYEPWMYKTPITETFPFEWDTRPPPTRTPLDRLTSQSWNFVPVNTNALGNLESDAIHILSMDDVVFTQTGYKIGTMDLGDTGITTPFRWRLNGTALHWWQYGLNDWRYDDCELRMLQANGQDYLDCIGNVGALTFEMRVWGNGGE